MLPEFMNLLRKFYFMRAAAQSTRVEMLLFDRLKSLSRLRKGFEAVEKLTFSEQPLDRNHAFDRIPKKNRALQAHFFFPCINSEVHAPGIYEFAPQIPACRKRSPIGGLFLVKEAKIW